MQETWVQSLGQEDPLEKEVATHSSIPAWKNPMDRGAWWATVHGVTESVMTEQNVHTQDDLARGGGKRAGCWAEVPG